MSGKFINLRSWCSRQLPAGLSKVVGEDTNNDNNNEKKIESQAEKNLNG